MLNNCAVFVCERENVDSEVNLCNINQVFCMMNSIQEERQINFESFSLVPFQAGALTYQNLKGILPIYSPSSQEQYKILST